MARPKTKGSTIGVQLPLIIDRTVREAAKRLRMSPGEFIGQLVVREVTSEPVARNGTWNPTAATPTSTSTSVS